MLSDASDLLGTPLAPGDLAALSSACLELANEAALDADASMSPVAEFLHQLADGGPRLDVYRVLTLHSVGLAGGDSHSRQVLASKRRSSVHSSSGGTTDIVPSADVSTQNWTVADLPVESVRVHGNLMKRRSIGRKSHLIGGMEIRQTRAADSFQRCRSRFWRLSSDCRHEGGAVAGGSGGAAAFGRDPAFNAKSSLFSAAAAQNEGQYYNVSQGSSEVTASGFPSAFFPRSSSKQKPVFVVVLPVRPLLMYAGHACRRDGTARYTINFAGAVM